ncbi:Phosphatidylinositol transfer protein alpha isoform [Nymphon striatum]|nr:Phosphatidylinositol transfer protein alpha isoform [Nymphon striatum]
MAGSMTFNDVGGNMPVLGRVAADYSLPCTETVLLHAGSSALEVGQTATITNGVKDCNLIIVAQLDPSFAQDFCIARIAYQKGIRNAKSIFIKKQSEDLIIKAKEHGNFAFDDNHESPELNGTGYLHTNPSTSLKGVYQVGQLYSVAEMSKNETGGGEGVEIKKNQPYKAEEFPDKKMADGQYTHKIYHIDQKINKYMRKLVPKGSLEFHEEAWNAYPHCRTGFCELFLIQFYFLFNMKLLLCNEEVTNPKYMKEKFKMIIETVHKEDRGESENAVNLSPELLEKREIIYIDISQDSIKDYKKENDPKLFKSEKTGRGPLTGDWMQTCTPIMCAYKVVVLDIQLRLIQNMVQKYAMTQEQNLFHKFHCEVFCWIDKWIELSMEDIRSLENKTQEVLDEERDKGEVKGTIDE